MDIKKIGLEESLGEFFIENPILFNGFINFIRDYYDLDLVQVRTYQFKVIYNGKEYLDYHTDDNFVIIKDDITEFLTVYNRKLNLKKIKF